MAKGAHFPRAFWDSSLKTELWRFPQGHLRVFLHLAYGPSAHLSGIYRISVPAIAEDVDMDPEDVRLALRDLQAIGWCDVEYPLIWIRGTGNILDKLGTTGLAMNKAWVTSTARHLSDLPESNRLVGAFRGFHDLPGVPGGEAPPLPHGVPGGVPSSSSCPSPSPSSSTEGVVSSYRGGSPKFREQDEHGLDIREEAA